MLPAPCSCGVATSEHCEVTLNLCRPSHRNCLFLHGRSSISNVTPLPLTTPRPLAVRWLQFLLQQVQTSWSAHSEEGFYIGSALTATSSTVSGHIHAG
jgi:hypothetical protein